MSGKAASSCPGGSEGEKSTLASVRENLLAVEDLRTWFYTDDGTARAVDGITLKIPQSQTVGLVGESGCGKSVTAHSILRLVPDPPGKIINGKIHFEGQNLLDLSQKEMRAVRGKQISMVFQEPMTSLNPVFTVGNQIIESLRLHENMNLKEARERTIELLAKVKIPAPEQRIDNYPHQLSGGMKQRAMIAMAIACNPKLLIADEPTTALDVTIQAQILDLLAELQSDFGMSIMLITHDLAVVAQVVSSVYIMYAGKVVEHATVENLFDNPRHPYTWGLFDSIPKPTETHRRLKAIPGVVPNPLHHPPACRFHPRCTHARDICKRLEPELIEQTPGHLAACHKTSKHEEY
jgi:peptide/nickel transport system ATP-binding protein